MRPEADSPALTGVLERQLGNGRVYLAFRYDVIRVWEMSADELLAGGLGTLTLAPIARLETRELPDVLRRMETRFDLEAGDEAGELWTATKVLMGLRYTRATTNRLLKGVRQMRDSVTYMEIVEEGIAEGITRGRVAGEQWMVVALAERRLGSASNEVRSRINAIESPERLVELADKIPYVETWDAFLAYLD